MESEYQCGGDHHDPAETSEEADDGDSSASWVISPRRSSHHVINAFSAIVSNAELIRSRTSGAHPTRPSSRRLGTAIVETALDASQVARKLIDWARRATAIERRPGRPRIPGGRPESTDPEKSSNPRRARRPTGSTGSSIWVRFRRSPVMPRSFGRCWAICCRTLARPCRRVRERSRSPRYIDPRNWLVVAIRDSGCGMSAGGPQTRDRAFLQHQARPQRASA